MKKHILIITSDDTSQTFTLIDCDTRKVVHAHSTGYCYDDEEEQDNINLSTFFCNDYTIIKL